MTEGSRSKLKRFTPQKFFGVRAYTDCVEQALLGAEKVAIVKQATLRCNFPYALEGLMRRELERAGATLADVQHTAHVEITFTMPQDAAAELVAGLNEAGNGRLKDTDSQT